MSPSIQDVVVAALSTTLPRPEAPLALHEPCFSGNEWQYVKECLDTGWVSSVGGFVDRFEAALAAHTGALGAVATVNGTAALHVALRLVDVGPGDEVVVPALSFVATANAVVYCAAVPHFADSEEATLGLDPGKLDAHLREITERRGDRCVNRLTGRTIRAVVPMHTLGHPVDLDALVEVCERHRLSLVEDAAEALGTTYKGRHAGTVGRVGVLSFNGNKILTTGGGGALLTQDPGLRALAKHLTTTAKVPHAWSFAHDMVGYNYRMPNLNAALGCAQLERLPEFLASKRALAARYAQTFAATEGVSFVHEPAFARSNYWLNALLLNRADEAQRDAVLAATNRAGYMTRPVWDLLHTLPMYRDCPRMDLTCAEDLARRLVCLPSSARLGASDAA